MARHLQPTQGSHSRPARHPLWMRLALFILAALTLSVSLVTNAAISEAAHEITVSPRPTTAGAPIEAGNTIHVPLVTGGGADGNGLSTTPATKAVVQLAWFNKPPADGNLEPLKRRFRVFILAKQHGDLRDTLETEGVAGSFLQYVRFEAIHDPGGCDVQPWRNQVADQFGDFCRISVEHPDWFLLDTSGNRIVMDEGGERFYAMDPGHPGWRAFWLERVRAGQAEGWDGLSIDNLDASLARWQRRGITPAAYPDDASYQAAVEAFLAYISSAYFKPEGRLLQANVTGVRDPAVWFRYLQYLDGAMEEGWGVDWSSGYLSPARWEEHLSRVEQTQALGKNTIVVSQGAREDWSRQQFAFASYLLVSDGRASFRYSDSSSYRHVWLYSNYDLDLGQPLGPRYANGSAWQRDFTNGSVVVDPAAHTATIVTHE
ncbi:MAG TPA: putative glycoside hydrolase [Ardenticatenaceae bacterium]|nr:putative glycoside hydrolase [Ardenticatenaceae bacterium]